MADPYAEQLRGFTSSIPNARRGLIDLYKLRRRSVDTHTREIRDVYKRAGAATKSEYGASLKALGGYEGEGLGMAKASGYDMGDPDVRAAVTGLVRQGTSPFNAFLRSEQGAQGQLWRGYRAGEEYEDTTLRTGLKREQPAALSELEQGIIDTQTSLTGQSQAYQANQQFLTQQQNYMNQMLQYQGQMAGAQGGGIGAGPQYGYGGGQLSAAEQWIIGKESSGNVHADNPTSSAFGLGQLLIGNRQKYARQLGFDPNTTDYGQQLQMMRAYIAERYGTAEAAMAFWKSHGWY